MCVCVYKHCLSCISLVIINCQIVEECALDEPMVSEEGHFFMETDLIKICVAGHACQGDLMPVNMEDKMCSEMGSNYGQ